MSDAVKSIAAPSQRGSLVVFRFGPPLICGSETGGLAVGNGLLDRYGLVKDGIAKGTEEAIALPTTAVGPLLRPLARGGSRLAIGIGV